MMPFTGLLGSSRLGWFAVPGICVILGCTVPPLVRAQESNLLLGDTANFLDAGLTALGLITALVTTVLRRRMDAETNTRDLLTLLGGESQGSVKTLTVYDQHSLSQVLVLVEETSKTWAHQVFSYYGATTAKRAELMPVAWLCPPPGCTPSVSPARCSCNATCKCLRMERVEGVCKHLTTVAPGSVFRVDDTYDAIICSSCFAHNCHNSKEAYYQDAGSLGPSDFRGAACRRALAVSAANIFAAEGHTGLMLVEPANEESVTWGSTISEASTVRDSEERGNENPFTVSYRKALAGEASPTQNDTEFDPTLWWISRVCAFVLACALVAFFRTDAFSCALLTRRAMRGYMVDSTQTKLPLSSFCSAARCETSLDNHFIVVTLEPIVKGWFSLPKERLLVASALEGILVLLWITIIAITPWFHLVGSSYLSGVPIWATAVSCLVVIVASSINIHYWRRNHSITRFNWAILTAICAFIDASVLVLSALVWAKVVAGHWAATATRGLIMVGAILQWVLGVLHLPTTTNSSENHRRSWSLVVPYALTFLRLLALVAGGGKWA
jgi:hypothetical protein